jgi:hypothetical protein
MPDDEISVDTSELDGLAELLDRFPLDVQDKMIKQSLGAGAAVFMLGVMEKTPVRTDEVTGKSTALKPGMVKADIHAVAGKSGRAWYIGAGPKTAFVMRWLERGHLLVKGGTTAWTNGKRSRRGSGGHVIKHVPAHPVLRPAFDGYWRTALHATAVELEARIAKYWKETLGKLKRAA